MIVLMDRWSDWKAVKDAAARQPALERRIEDLERRLQRCPGEGCPKCGELEFRPEQSRRHSHAGFARLGARMIDMKCAACGFTDVRTTGPAKG